EPAFHPAKYKPVAQRLTGRGSCERQGLVAVGALQALQPSRSVKDRRLRMRVQKLIPAAILDRINLINGHGQLGNLMRQVLQNALQSYSLCAITSCAGSGAT